MSMASLIGRRATARRACRIGPPHCHCNPRSSQRRSWPSCGPPDVAGVQFDHLVDGDRSAQVAEAAASSARCRTKNWPARRSNAEHDRHPVGPGVDRNSAPIPASSPRRRPPSLSSSTARDAVRARRRTGDARDVHHLARSGVTALGRGPRLSRSRPCRRLIQQRLPVGLRRQAVRYRHQALNTGILKVMSKMGISTLQSYCGAQLFEAVGLDSAFVDRYFTWTASRIGGIGVDVVADEVAKRHARRVPDTVPRTGGPGMGRRISVAARRRVPPVQPRHRLQAAALDAQRAVPGVQGTPTEAGRRTQNRARATLRGLLELRPAGEPVPLDEVEPVEHIVRRFATGAMSVRVDQPGSARDAGDRDEPARRKIQHR